MEDLYQRFLRLAKEAEEKRKMSPLGRRVSEIGSNEYARDYLRPGVAATTIGETVNYRPEFFNDPETMAHERIHVGQNRLKGKPPKEQVFKIFPKEVSGRHQADERAAYGLTERFASGKELKDWENIRKKTYPSASASILSNITSGIEKRNQDTLRQVMDYINMLKRLNLGDRGIATIEASLPEPLRSKYLKLVAPPVRIPVFPEEQ